MNGCHHCVLLIVADERLEMRIYSAADGAFPKIAAAKSPTFHYSIQEYIPKNRCRQQSKISLQYINKCMTIQIYKYIL